MMALALLALSLTGSLAAEPAQEPLRVASKSFTESVVLGELARLRLEGAGFAAEHVQGLGGSRLAFNALIAGEVDVYAEYTGTLMAELLAEDAPADLKAASALLSARGIVLGQPLGFENNYAIGMLRGRAAKLQLQRLSDLSEARDLVVRVSNEFMLRADGWPGLVEHYGLQLPDARGIEHELAYRGLTSGSVDLIDMYTTDAKIRAYDLLALEDDRGFFPRYEAVLLYRSDLAERAPGAVDALTALEGRIDTAAMVGMNATVELEGRSETAAAAAFLETTFDVTVDASVESRAARIWRHTLEHLALVGVALLLALLVAVPLGVVAAKRERLGQFVLGAVGIGQTIPALALLVFMIPVFGIGSGPAIVALFLYSLLPIVRNTHAGLTGIPIGLRDTARAIGLPPGAALRRVELPLALPSILAGVQTAAVICVGAATLGALVGAGGYGQPILAGLRLADTLRILEGAVPAALMAVAVQGLFELVERALVPKAMR